MSTENLNYILLISIFVGLVFIGAIVYEFKRDQTLFLELQNKYLRKRARLFKNVGRVSAFLLLISILAGVTYTSVSCYWALSDSWVAPYHLTSDANEVIEAHLKVQQHMDKIQSLKSRVSVIKDTLNSKRVLFGELTKLQNKLVQSLNWSVPRFLDYKELLTKHTELLRKNEKLSSAVNSIQELVQKELNAEFQAGMLSRAEFEKQKLAINQLKILQNDNEIKRSMTEFNALEASASFEGWTQEKREVEKFTQNTFAPGKFARELGSLSQQLVEAKPNEKILPPQILKDETEILNVSSNLVNVYSEIRSLEEELKNADDNIKSLEVLALQIKKQPAYQALFKTADVAFVPYTQLKAIQSGDRVLQCAYGVFFCKDVGSVVEILPGEVKAIDTWGEYDRGQYALLQLNDEQAFKKHVLRIRRN